MTEAHERFIQHMEAPKEWRELLDRFTPPPEVQGHLEMVWEPGDPWGPVQRFQLWETTPVNAVNYRGDPLVNFDELRSLRGPHPRTMGHICTSVPVSQWVVPPPKGYVPCGCWRKREAWHISEAEERNAGYPWGGEGGCCPPLTQWLLFQRTGLVGRPFWVVEGERGGHKFDFTTQERELLAREGLPTETPDPGSLPFAPVDQRVIQAILPYYRLRAFNDSIRRYQKTMGDGYAQFRAETEKDMRVTLLHYLKQSLQEVNDLVPRAIGRGEFDHAGHSEIDFDRLDEENDRYFVETGNILSPAALR